MKSRMDKYYKEEELMQRTSKNDSLYDELYKERLPKSNVTVIDNINEIDITKIKSMVDSRENYKRVRDYENLVNPIENYKKDEIEYNFDEIDYSNYDINEIIKNKRSSKTYDTDPNRVRKITNDEYDILSSLEIKNDEFSDDLINHEKQLKDLFNTVSRTVIDDTDLFSNLKEEKEEQTFYTSTSNFESDDFKDEVEGKNSSKLFVVISVIAILIAIGVIVYIKFFK